MPLKSLFDTDTGTRYPEYDVRKFSLHDRRRDHQLGEVNDVLVDDDSNPRYLAVRRKNDESTLLPVGYGRVDRDQRRIYVIGVDQESFAQAPRYSGDPSGVDDAHESNVASHFASSDGDDYYGHPDYTNAALGHSGETGSAASGKLARLDELDDYKVADHSCDPRGWKVCGRRDEELGKVNHLMADTGDMEARYLVVDVDHDLVNEERQVLVPAGHVRLSPDDKTVFTSVLDRATIAEAPAYREESFDRGYEDRVRGFYGQRYAGNRYDHPRYQSERLYDERNEQIAQT